MDKALCSALLGLWLVAGPATAAPPAPAKAAPQSGAASKSATAPKATSNTEQRAACTSRDPLRKALFGETHSHTSYSLDALSQATNNAPSVAYTYAKGSPIMVADASGNPTRCAQKPRPLDWAAITDHSEFLGAITLCSTEGSPEYNSQSCQDFRADIAGTTNIWGAGLNQEVPVPPAMCGADNKVCHQASSTLWTEIQNAAEAAYDRSSACTFTSFVAYEWTSAPGNNNRHRNVIFRNANVPALPISVFETSNDERQLWAQLRTGCLDAETGCDVLTIPHNGNLSDGQLYALPADANAGYAAERATWEPLSEIHQGKGNSECRENIGNTDPECGFEQVPQHNLDTGSIDDTKPFPQNAFLRNVLKDGLAHQKSLGANPYKYGFAGGTDTHIASPGSTDEGNFMGLHGSSSGDSAGMLSQVDLNAGAVTVVWAEENTRDSIFDALERRETYATSGNRPTVRFFGGWDLPTDMCGDGFAQKGYDLGVPMGSDLPIRTGSSRLRFAVHAVKDPGTTAPNPLPDGNCAVYKPGAQLNRIEIVKGWIDSAGVQHEKVITVAGSPTLDPASTVSDACVPQGPGADALCQVWEDPEFDPTVPAFYYARLLENPTCRWSTYTCKEAGFDPFKPDACQAHLASFSKKSPKSGGSSPHDVYSICCTMEPGPVVDPTQIPRVAQQRAWTSPIWYTPSAAAQKSAKKASKN